MPDGVIDEFADLDGDKISVEVMGPNVYLTASSHGFHACVRLDAELRDRFERAWAKAKRRAEASSATEDDFTADPHHDPGVAWAAGDDTAYRRTPEDSQ